ELEGEDDIYSARIGLEYRALAVMKKDRFVWYWIGKNAEYDRLIGRSACRGDFSFSGHPLLHHGPLANLVAGSFENRVARLERPDHRHQISHRRALADVDP